MGYLCEYLSSATTSQTVLQMFVDMALVNPHAFVNHISKLKQSCEQNPANLALTAKIIGPAGKTNKVSPERNNRGSILRGKLGKHRTKKIEDKKKKSPCSLWGCVRQCFLRCSCCVAQRPLVDPIIFGA